MFYERGGNPCLLIVEDAVLVPTEQHYDHVDYGFRCKAYLHYIIGGTTPYIVGPLFKMDAPTDER